MINCLHCGAETSNGLALCGLCHRKATTDLEFIPIYFRNLARWRPGRAGSRPVPGSRVLYDGATTGLGTGDRISDTLDQTTDALKVWAEALTTARSFPRPLTFADAVLTNDLPAHTAEQLHDNQPALIAALCAGFNHHLTSASTTNWCGELAHDLGQYEADLRRLTETSVPGWYAGACRQVIAKTLDGDVHCGASTYVVPGLTWVACRGCGMRTYARDHLDIVLIEACDWIAPPKRIAEAIVALVDTEQSVPRLYARIRQWSAREDITPIRRTARGYAWSEQDDRMVVADEEVGQARYRLGDVLDKVLTARVTGVDRATERVGA